jgi:hypothetical protein
MSRSACLSKLETVGRQKHNRPLHARRSDDRAKAFKEPDENPAPAEGRVSG